MPRSEIIQRCRQLRSTANDCLNAAVAKVPASALRERAKKLWLSADERAKAGIGPAG